LENTDKNLKEEERKEQIFKMPDNLRRRGEKPPVAAKSPQKPKSILKAPKSERIVKAESGTGMNVQPKPVFVADPVPEPVEFAEKQEKPAAFTSLPASANPNLMAFE
jgi:hypothetical protein